MPSRIPLRRLRRRGDQALRWPRHKRTGVSRERSLVDARCNELAVIGPTACSPATVTRASRRNDWQAIELAKRHKRNLTDCVRLVGTWLKPSGIARLYCCDYRGLFEIDRYRVRQRTSSTPRWVQPRREICERNGAGDKQTNRHLRGRSQTANFEEFARLAALNGSACLWHH
jgi:hypothetical protein